MKKIILLLLMVVFATGCVEKTVYAEPEDTTGYPVDGEGPAFDFSDYTIYDEEERPKFEFRFVYNEAKVPIKEGDIFEIKFRHRNGEDVSILQLDVSEYRYKKAVYELTEIYDFIPYDFYVVTEIKYIGDDPMIANQPYACQKEELFNHTVIHRSFGDHEIVELADHAFFKIYIGEDAVTSAENTYGEKQLLYKGMLIDQHSPSRDPYETARLAEAGEFVTEPMAPDNNIFTTKVPLEKTTEKPKDKYENYFSNKYSDPIDVPSGYQEIERKEDSEKKTNVISVVLVILLVIVSGIGAIIRYLDSKNQK